MRIFKLEAVHYPNPPRAPGQTRFGYTSIATTSPAFSDVEAAIRRLDRDEWPYVWLHTDPPPKDEFPNNLLEIMGGRGEYAITLYRDGDETFFLDRGRRNDDRTVQIWESDQGRETVPWSLCNDLGVVLQIAHFFCTRAALPPDHAWKVS